MKVVPVLDKKSEKAFLDFPVHLYKNNPKWIKPLDEDIRKVFSAKDNSAFQSGNAARWILKKGENTIGRIAAFYNQQEKITSDIPAGGMGFFECINSEKAAELLLMTAEEWLAGNGFEAIEGPINFGSKDKWWGLLIDGFDIAPCYCNNYNPPYYQDLLINHGFSIIYRQLIFKWDLNTHLPPDAKMEAVRVLHDPEYEVRQIDTNELESFAFDLQTVFNESKLTKKHHRYLDFDTALMILESLKPIMQKELIHFAYFQGRPVAYLIVLPELNQIIKHLDGKFNQINKIKCKYHQWKGSCRKLYGSSIGIDTNFKGLGIEAALMHSFSEAAQDLEKWDEMEMTWIGDFNQEMVQTVKSIGGKHIKTHATFKKIIPTEF